LEEAIWAVWFDINSFEQLEAWNYTVANQRAERGSKVRGWNTEAKGASSSLI